MYLPEANPWNKEMWLGLCQILQPWSLITEAHELSMWEGLVQEFGKETMRRQNENVR